MPQSFGKSRVEKNFPDLPSYKFARPQQLAGGGVGEENAGRGIDQQKRVAERVQQSVALVAGVAEVAVEPVVASSEFGMESRARTTEP
jgi:hypothetical protein